MLQKIENQRMKIQTLYPKILQKGYSQTAQMMSRKYLTN